MRNAMQSDDGSPPQLWHAEAGDQLIGELVRLEERETRVGTAQVAIIADADSGQLWSVFLTRTVLKNEFERQAPRPGDVVGIKYHGTRPFRSGEGTYHHYTVRVSRPPATAPTSAQANRDLDGIPEIPF
jgi:hypothetical protein